MVIIAKIVVFKYCDICIKLEQFNSVTALILTVGYESLKCNVQLRAKDIDFFLPYCIVNKILGGKIIYCFHSTVIQFHSQSEDALKLA